MRFLLKVKLEASHPVYQAARGFGLGLNGTIVKGCSGGGEVVHNAQGSPTAWSARLTMQFMLRDKGLAIKLLILGTSWHDGLGASQLRGS